MDLATRHDAVGKNSGGSTSTDLYQLWQKAFVSYNSNLKGKSSKQAVSIENLPRIRSVDGVVAQVDEASRKWNRHLHDKGQLDRLRSAVGEYLGLAQTVGDLVVQSAVASFPPAAAVWTVATYAIKTAQTQQADYAKLTDLIVEAGGFLKVLHIIETKVPGSKQYQECVTEVFTSLLVIFAIQTRFMNESRVLTFFRDAVRGNDPELAAAYTKVRKAIDRLSQANGFRAVANTEDLIRLMGDLDLKLDMHHGEIMRVFTEQGEKFQGLFQLGWEQISLMQGVDKALKEMVKNVNTHEQGSKSQGISSKLKSANRKGAHLVNFAFANPTDPAIQYREIESHFVPGTSKWLFEHDHFLSWKDGRFPLLYISAARGVGKTFLAYTIVKSLKESLNDQPRPSIAYYFFDRRHDELSSVRNALCSIITQIADMDNRYCEKVATDLASEDMKLNDADLQYLWKKYVASNFAAKSEAELYLILDGLDEIDSADRSTFLDLLDQIPKRSLKIRAILTSRPATVGMEKTTTEVIEMTVKQTSHDIARIVEERCKTRRFTHHCKRKMVAKLAESADCLLYVDRMLHDLKALGGGRKLWEALDELPDGLADLYTKLLTKNRAKRNPMEWNEAKRLYAFVAFTITPLTLKELVHLLSPFTQNKLIDVEQEISGDSASILELARYLREDGVTADALDFRQSGARTDDFDSVADDDGSASVRFRERSLEEFFRRFKADDDLVASGLVASPLEANLDLLYASIKLMCAPHHERDEHPADGLGHAVNCWYLYLSDPDVDIALATDSQVTRVIDILKEISVNRAEVAKAIEEHCKHGYYADFASQGLPAIEAWTKCAASSAGADEWLVKMAAEPEEILRHLARGHVVNWYQRVDWDLAERSFSAARDALHQTTSNPVTSEATGLEAIEAVAHYFDDLRPISTGSQRAVALTLVGSEQYGKALTYCDNNLTNCVDVQEHFLTQVIRADIYASMADATKDQDSEEAKSHWEHSGDYASAALALSSEEMSSSNSTAMKEMRWWALRIRADYENHAGQYKEAVKTNEVAKDIWPERSGPLLRRVAIILNDKKEYAELMKKVESWELENRLYWLALTDPYEPESFFTGGNAIFQKAAKLASSSEASSDRTPISARGTLLSDSLASMIRIYEEMIEYLERKNQSACLRYRLACAYREVIGDDLSSKDILDTLLNGDSCYDPCIKQESEITLIGIRFDLATIIFEEFQASNDRQQKIALLNELEDIPNRQLGKALGRLELFNLATAIIQGKMIRKVRSAPEYQAHMEKAFETCIDALSDLVGWNDQPSFTLLGKLLTCVKGLERDAQIAISAQFSHVDTNLAQSRNEADDPDDGELSPKSPQAAGLADGNIGNHEQLTTAKEEDASVAHVQKSDVKMKADHLKDSSTDALKSDPNSSEGRPENQEEDIMPWAAFLCAGCGKMGNSWAEIGPVYTCLICPMCDLCQECYDKRQALNRGDTSASWRSFCGKDHEYLKAPMLGWKGVKDGVMTIGEQRQEFKVWLKELRDERWVKAWTEFWKGA